MSYVVYHKHTTVTLKSGISTQHFATEAAARGALTRLVKDGKTSREDYAIAEANVFSKTIEKQIERTNLMSGKKFTQPANTPLCCDPSSETYWSM